MKQNSGPDVSRLLPSEFIESPAVHERSIGEIEASDEFDSIAAAEREALREDVHFWEQTAVDSYFDPKVLDTVMFEQQDIVDMFGHASHIASVRSRLTLAHIAEIFD